MLKLVLISSVLIGIAALGLGVQVFFSKRKKFPDTKIGHNKEMTKRKIYCPQTQDKIAQKRKNQWQGPI
ncbi:MAG: hypothetical protein GQ527_10345 [Bacteroidales bacterium]|nr:hypothetical protein [Bacteroidales bacterium]